MTKLLTEQDTEVFTQVSTIAQGFRDVAMQKSNFRTLDWLTEKLSILTGAFMYLTTRYNQVKSARDNNELSKYIQLKQDAVAAGDKFVSASAERESAHEVRDLNEAEKVLESYKDASDQGILTAKKLIEVELLELQREVK